MTAHHQGKDPEIPAPSNSQEANPAAHERSAHSSGFPLSIKDLPQGPALAGANVLKSLETTVWAMRLYDVENENCRMQIKNLELNLQDFFKQFGTLVWVMKYKQAYLKEDDEKNPIWVWDGTDSSLIHRLYMEGIQEMEFLCELERTELITFLKILAADYNSYNFMGEDVASMLWKESFKNIRHRTLEGLEQLDFIELADTSDQEKNKEIFRHILTNLSSPGLLEKGILKELMPTGDKQPPKIESLVYPDAIPVCNTGEGRLLFINSEDLQSINEQVENDRKHDFIKDVQQLIFEMLEVGKSVSSLHLPYNFILLTADEYLEKGRWFDLKNLVDRLTAFKQRLDDPSHPAIVALEQTIDQLTNEHRVRSIEKHLVGSEHVSHIQELKNFISSLPARAVRPLMEMVFHVPRGAVRRSLLEALAFLGQGQESIFNSLFETLEGEDLPDYVFLLSQLDLEKTLPKLLQLAKDCEGKTKEEAMIALLPSNDAKIRHFMLACLHEIFQSAKADLPHIKIATRYFIHHKDFQAARELKEFSQEKNFQNRPLGEKLGFFKILGEIGGKTLIPYFEELLQDSSGLFAKKSSEENKLCALTGLSRINHPRSLELIQKEEQNGKNSPKIKSRCQMALKELQELRKEAKEEP